MLKKIIDYLNRKEIASNLARFEEMKKRGTNNYVRYINGQPPKRKKK